MKITKDMVGMGLMLLSGIVMGIGNILCMQDTMEDAKREMLEGGDDEDDEEECES